MSSPSHHSDESAGCDPEPGRGGPEFEAKVHNLLHGLAVRHPKKVTVTRQPTVELQNGEVVRPDFDLTILLPWERSYYFIECQDRKTFSKDLLHKIQHVRGKGWRKTFAFVYPEALPEEVSRAMRDEGVMLFALKDFESFITKLDKGIECIQSGITIGTIVQSEDEDVVDRAMLSSRRLHHWGR